MLFLLSAIGSKIAAAAGMIAGIALGSALGKKTKG